MTLIKKHKNLLPVLGLAILCLSTVLQVIFIELNNNNGEPFHLYFLTSHILAFVAVAADLTIYFLARKFFKYAVIATIIAGLFGALNFTVNTYGVRIFITFEPVSFCAGLAYILLNIGRIKGRSYTNAIEHDTEKIAQYKERFSEKTNEELSALTIDTRFTPEAKAAAAELLTERSRHENEQIQATPE